MQIVLQYFQGLCANVQAAPAPTTTAAATVKATTKAGGVVTTVTVPAKTTTSGARSTGSSQSLNAKPKPWYVFAACGKVTAELMIS